MHHILKAAFIAAPHPSVKFSKYKLEICAWPFLESLLLLLQLGEVSKLMANFPVNGCK